MNCGLSQPARTGGGGGEETEDVELRWSREEEAEDMELRWSREGSGSSLKVVDISEKGKTQILLKTQNFECKWS